MDILMNNRALGTVGVVVGAVMLALLICGFFGLAQNPVWHVADSITVVFFLTLGWRLMCEGSCPGADPSADSGTNPT